MQTRSRRIEILLAWLRERGARFPKIEVVCDGEDRARVVAREPVSDGEVLISLPWDCALTLRYSREGRPGAAAAGEVEGADEQVQLALLLLQERGRRDSPWRAYLDALPQAYPENPLFYDAERLAYLRGSYVLETLLARSRRYAEEHRDLLRAAPDRISYALDDYRWARTVVQSRCFRVRRDDRQMRALLPLIDLVDHASGGSAAWGVRDDVDGVACWAVEHIAPGDEIRHSYGTAALGRRFASHGFVEPDRRHDDARIVLLPDPDDPALEEKASLVPALRKRHYFVGRQYDAGFLEILTVARAIHVQELDEAAREALREQRALSPANEAVALHEIASACRHALAHFPTTISDDRAALEELRPEQEGARPALELVLREKEVLRDCAAFAREAEGILRRTRLERRERMEALPAGDALRAYLGELMDWD